VLRHNGKQDAEGRHIDPDAIDRVVRKYAGALGLNRGYSAHSMRATFITTALENGAQLEDVRKAAGHRDPSTTNIRLCCNEGFSGDGGADARFENSLLFSLLSKEIPGQRRVRSRGNDWTQKYPAIAEDIARLPAKNAYLDGELCGVLSDGRTSFNLIQNASGTGKGGSLVFFLFDLLFLDGENLTEMPLVDRKVRLEKLLAGAPFFREPRSLHRPSPSGGRTLPKSGGVSRAQVRRVLQSRRAGQS
jgi:hypothetical protein